MKKITKEVFVERVKKVFNNRYDTSNIIFVNMITPVCLYDNKQQIYKK